MSSGEVDRYEKWYRQISRLVFLNIKEIILELDFGLHRK